jgi:hypothetical protein
MRSPLMLAVDVTPALEMGHLFRQSPGLHSAPDPIEALILKVQLLIDGAALGNQLAPSFMMLSVPLDFCVGGGVVKVACSLAESVEQLRQPIEQLVEPHRHGIDGDVR